MSVPLSFFYQCAREYPIKVHTGKISSLGKTQGTHLISNFSMSSSSTWNWDFLV